jgi:regulator of nonsense transcripts 2
VPSEAPLAVQTRTAQIQDQEQQQHLKRLVLDYVQREQAEERKGEQLAITILRKIDGFAAIEANSRFGGVKIRFFG